MFPDLEKTDFNSTRNWLNQQLGVSWRYDNKSDTSRGLANSTIAIRNEEALYFLKTFFDLDAQQRELVSLKLLGEKGFEAPRIVAANTRNILITSVGVPLRLRERAEEWLVRIGMRLRQLHELDTSELSFHRFSASQADRLNRRLHKHFRGLSLRSSLLHGDITWSNTVLNDSDQIVLIDFEEAGLGHPLVDLSIAAVECCWNEFGADGLEAAISKLALGYDDPAITDMLLVGDPETGISACELAAEELLTWSSKHGEFMLSEKYICFINYLRKGK